jgi:hypothetical protein
VDFACLECIKDLRLHRAQNSSYRDKLQLCASATPLRRELDDALGLTAQAGESAEARTGVLAVW